MGSRHPKAHTPHCVNQIEENSQARTWRFKESTDKVLPCSLPHCVSTSLTLVIVKVRGALSKGKSKGGIPPDSLCEEEDAILDDMKRCIKEFHDDSK